MAVTPSRKNCPRFAGQCASGAGYVDIYNSAGSTQVIVDVFGYFIGS
jgi:hypothetical protein